MARESAKTTTARVQVYELLKNDISTGVYPAGYRLREQELSDRYHISRSPIREALRQLASEGLVTEVPNHGATVREMSHKEMTELFDARVMLETYAIFHIPPEALKAHREELFALLTISEQAYADHDLKLFTMMDKQLHTVLISLCGNDLIAEFYSNIRVRSNWFRTYALSAPGRWEETLKEHRALVEALCDGRLEDAREANTQHLQKAQESVATYLATHQK